MVERSGTPFVVLHSLRHALPHATKRIEVVIEDSTPSTKHSRDRFAKSSLRAIAVCLTMGAGSFAG